MSNPLHNPQVDATLQSVFLLIAPEAVLLAAACVLYVYSTFRPNRLIAISLAMFGLLGATVAWFLTPAPASTPILTVAPLIADSLSNFVRPLAYLSGALFVMLASKEADSKRIADYLACLLIAVAGVSLTSAANDLVTIFLALEMISIPTYILLYLPRVNKLSQESAIKYFMLSILSSSLLLFGFSYFYGATGVTNLSAILAIMPRIAEGQGAILVLIAAVMVIAGLSFRITAVPFHFYAPDVYQGGPTGVAAFLAFVPKIAGFVLMLRFFTSLTGILPYSEQVSILLWSLAAITMTFGNVLALLQTNIKRLLAYSSVAHAGYMLIGVAVASNVGVRTNGLNMLVHGNEAIMFYLIAYGAMTIGAFAVIIYLSSNERPIESILDLAGLGHSHPQIAFMMALFLFSLIGLPLTAGFAGKFLLFAGALSVPQAAPMHTLYQVLVVIAAINAAIAAVYYLKILAAMYLRTSSFDPPKVPHASLPYMAMVICAGITILAGVYPWPLLELSKSAVTVIAMPSMQGPMVAMMP